MSGDRTPHPLLRRLDSFLVPVVLGCVAAGALLMEGPDLLIHEVDGGRRAVWRQVFEIERALLLYRFDHGALPDALRDLTDCQPETTEPYVEAGMLDDDPWGNPIRYSIGEEWLQGFLVSSAGRDGEFGTEDDITSDRRRRR